MNITGNEEGQYTRRYISNVKAKTKRTSNRDGQTESYGRLKHILLHCWENKQEDKTGKDRKIISSCNNRRALTDICRILPTDGWSNAHGKFTTINHKHKA